MGALVFSGVLVILVILSLIFYRYQRQQKLKQSILQDKMKIRQLELVGIKKDVELLSEAWNMDWKDIHLGDEPVARGSFGEVWHGLYRGKWEVAVKKMFDTEVRSFFFFFLICLLTLTCCVTTTEPTCSCRRIGDSFSSTSTTSASCIVHG
jgi:hypothetical protein